MRRLLGPVLLLLVTATTLAACSDESSGAGAIPEREGEAGGGVVRWGDGAYGVVLAHGAAFDAASWEDQATAIAEQGATVVAVEDISPESIEAAVQTLVDEGHPDVALVGGSAGADAILRLASEQPELGDQLVLLSPNTVVEGLGTQPKLFIASEDEPLADVSQQLADSAPGDDNQVLVLPGSDHAQNIFAGDQGEVALLAVLERLAQ